MGNGSPTVMPGASTSSGLSRRFSKYNFIPSTYGGRGGNPVLTRNVELERATYTFFQAWFPNPGGKLKGRLFEVRLESPELPEPVSTTIRF